MTGGGMIISSDYIEYRKVPMNTVSRMDLLRLRGIL